MESKQSQEQNWFDAFITPNKAIAMWEQSPRGREEGMKEAYTDRGCDFKMGWKAQKEFFLNQEKTTKTWNIKRTRNDNNN